MILSTKYIDEFGFIRPIHFEIEHNITKMDQQQIFQHDILQKYNNSILIVRGISDFTEIITEPSRIVTEKYSIDIKVNGFNYYTLPQPAFGSVTECLASNLSIDTQIECHKHQSYFEPIKIKLKPVQTNDNLIQLYFNEIRSSGIHTHVYDMLLEFSADRSTTCQSCIDGLNALRDQMTRLCNELYVAADNEYDIDGMVVSDLDVCNLDKLKDKLQLVLQNTLVNARVHNFQLVNTVLDVDENSYAGPDITF